MSILLFILSSLITLSSVWLVVQLTQNNYEKQEKLAVLRLLTVAESDLNMTIDRIETIGKAQINADDSKSNVIHFGSDPDDTLPYPMIFTDIITDRRVIINLSNTNLLILYPFEKKLDKSVYAIMNMKHNSPLKQTYYANYRYELKLLQLTLSGEIKYQKGQLSEEQVAKANDYFKSEALKDSPFKRLGSQ